MRLCAASMSICLCLRVRVRVRVRVRLRLRLRLASHRCRRRRRARARDSRNRARGDPTTARVLDPARLARGTRAHSRRAHARGDGGPHAAPGRRPNPPHASNITAAAAAADARARARDTPETGPAATQRRRARSTPRGSLEARARIRRVRMSAAMTGSTPRSEDAAAPPRASKEPVAAAAVASCQSTIRKERPMPPRA